MRWPCRFAALLLVALTGAMARADPGTDAAASPPGSNTISQTLAAARDRYFRLMEDGRNAEAAAAGQEVLALTGQLYGADSLELANPLTNIATAELRSGDLQAAEANYQAAIALLDKRAGFLSPRLINPLVGLGETYVRSEQYPQATETYARALRVNHVNEGFYNLEQMKIRDGLTEGYLGLQDLAKANFHQEAQLYVHKRKLGADNPELIEPLTKLGRWYDRSGQAESARFAYQSAARLAETAGGENAAALVEPMLAIAETYRQQALLPPDPDSSQSPDTLLPLSGMMLRKALGILEQQQPPDPAQRARVLVELGDLYLLWDKRKIAADRYAEAWQALSSDPALKEQRDEYFAQPTRIAGPAAPRIFPVPSPKSPRPNRADLEPGFVVLRFNVSPVGRVTDVTVVEADPANLLEEQVSRATRGTLFRPRYVDGAAVAANDLILRHEFRYAPRKLEKKDPPDGGDASPPLKEPSSDDNGGA